MEVYQVLHSYLKERDSGCAHRLLGRPGGVLLDIGCGDETDLESLCAQGWSAIGIDPFEHARVRSLVRGAAEHLPFKSTSCGAVTCVLVLPLVRTPPALISEAYRVLCRGGRAVFVVFSKSPLNVRIRITGQMHGSGRAVAIRHVFSRRNLWSMVRAGGFERKEIRQCVYLPWLAVRLSAQHLKLLTRAVARLEAQRRRGPLGAFAQKLIVLAVKR